MRIKIEGTGINGFISVLLKKRICMRNIKCISETETHMTVTDHDYNMIKKAAGKAYRITVISEQGYVPLIRNIKLKKATAFGLAVFMMIIYYQSLFISEIKIYGYEKIPEEKIRNVLAEVDFTEGSRKLKTKDELNGVKLYLFNKLGDVSFVGITYKGTLAEVTVIENQAGEGKNTDETPCDIISGKSGYIERVLPRNGTRKVSDGQYVKKGDVIISGIIPLSETSGIESRERYVHAKGLVELRVPYRFSFSVTCNSTDSMKGNNTISLTRKKGESDEELVKRAADIKIREFIKENIKEDVSVLNKHLNFKTKENIIDIDVLIEVLEKTGIEQEIFTDDREQPI